MQKHVNLVDLVKSFPTNIYLQNLASIQKITSPRKFAHLAEKSENDSISNLSTKVFETSGAHMKIKHKDKHGLFVNKSVDIVAPHVNFSADSEGEGAENQSLHSHTFGKTKTPAPLVRATKFPTPTPGAGSFSEFGLLDEHCEDMWKIEASTSADSLTYTCGDLVGLAIRETGNEAVAMDRVKNLVER